MWGLGCLIWEVFNGTLKSPASLKSLGNVRTMFMFFAHKQNCGQCMCDTHDSIEKLLILYFTDSETSGYSLL